MAALREMGYGHTMGASGGKAKIRDRDAVLRQ
jgi:hypothetical protein